MNNPNEERLNLVRIFLQRAQRFGGREALSFRPGAGQPYRSISWHDWETSVRRTASGLYGIGIRKGDRVALLSENRPEWTFADLGILSLGAINVPVYPTLSGEDVRYILNNAEVKALFLSSREQFDRLSGILTEVATLKSVILFDKADLPQPSGNFSCMRLDELMDRTKPFSDDEYASQVDSVAPSEPATIIYTSGTTGPPKGVMLSHANFVANYLGARERIQVTTDDVSLSFLPLSHVFERLAGYYFMAFCGARIAYAENMQTVPRDIQEVKPTVAASVPRLYEKIHARILEEAAKATGLKRNLFAWALKTGRTRARLVMSGKPVPGSLALGYAVAKRLVFEKIRQKLGGKIRFFISGGAPLSKEIAEFFFCSGILILEGYGLTETSPVITVNSEHEFRFGTVGKPLANVEVRIADDGEILTRGPCVMQGYYKNPEATAEVIRDGWFHTGDIGEFDPNGFLKITDRKKDIIVTSGGKNISPQNIEGLILSDSFFLQAVVIGDKRNYLVALLVPNREQVQAAAGSLGITEAWPGVLKHEKIMALAGEKIRVKTGHLSRYEQIKYFTLLDREFSQDAGEITPTLKIKRRFVMQKYSDVIDEMYRRGESYSESPRDGKA